MMRAAIFWASAKSPAAKASVWTASASSRRARRAAISSAFNSGDVPSKTYTGLMPMLNRVAVR